MMVGSIWNAKITPILSSNSRPRPRNPNKKPVPSVVARSSNGCALVIQLAAATTVEEQSESLAEIIISILLSVFPINCVASDIKVRPEED